MGQNLETEEKYGKELENQKGYSIVLLLARRAGNPTGLKSISTAAGEVGSSLRSQTVMYM